MTQPNFANLEGAAPGSEYDNLSNEELQRLINQAYKAKTGKQGQIRSAPTPVEKRHVDIDAIIRRYGGQ